MNKINILFILQTLDVGGSEKVVYDIVRAIDRNKFNPIVFGIAGGRLKEKLTELSIKTISYNKKPGFDIGLIKCINEIIKSLFDIFNCFRYLCLISASFVSDLFSK